MDRTAMGKPVGTGIRKHVVVARIADGGAEQRVEAEQVVPIAVDEPVGSGLGETRRDQVAFLRIRSLHSITMPGIRAIGTS